MGTETQLCIRDALYRLAQSATKKQALLGGVHIDGSDTAYSSQLSEEVNAKTSDGADISIESDPLSTNKASRYFFYASVLQNFKVRNWWSHVLTNFKKVDEVDL